MSNLHSPGEAEALRSELKELKEKVDHLEERLVRISQAAFISFIHVAEILVPAEKRAYFETREAHYRKLIMHSKDESDVSHHVLDFLQEISTHLKNS